MSYYEEVKSDVLDLIKWDGLIEKYKGDPDGLERYLEDTCWSADSVTGNASGSYFCNSNKAKEAVLSDMDALYDAVDADYISKETLGEWFLNQEWEAMDVMIRCSILSAAISDVVEELADELEEDEPEDEEEAPRNPENAA